MINFFKNKRVTLLLLAILFTVSQHSIAEETIKKDTEYSLLNHDIGLHQSPINIFTAKTKKSIKPPKFIINFNDKITAVENLGYTVRLDFKADSTLINEGIIYTLKQMHFHTPSEHLIDGITYPMELHIVSENNDDPDIPRYLVFGVLFKMGKDNPFIKKFLDLIPSKETAQQFKENNTLKLSDVLSPADLKKHYHYTGSLTTPPYTETVNWFILKRVLTASPDQIKAINKIEGNNARHIEPKNNRPVESN